MAVHPELGTVEHVRLLVSRARELGIEIALDMALQCARDHPYVKDHPEWFRRAPDGSLECGEDPPFRYEDVVTFDFGVADSLWREMRRIFVFWIEQGVRIFRVDNPHTKPFAFWEWLISDLKASWPDLVFLSEGLTRPAPMAHLTRVGFSLSYDHFPWQNRKEELVKYYTRLCRGEFKDCFRPCLWPHTPQYLPEFLQDGGRAAFQLRFVLAATLGAAYGIYGPAYELCDNRAVPGSVEYLDSEQYEIKSWDWQDTGLREFITLVNRIRRSNLALQSNDRLDFHAVDNDCILAFSKTTSDRSNVILSIVNLDPHHTQAGWVDLTLDAIGIGQSESYIVDELLTGDRYHWNGPRNYVLLNPEIVPAHLISLHRG